MADSENRKLPKGWQIVRFGDVVRDVNEAERNPLGAGLERYVGLEHIEPENLHLKAWGDLTTDELSFTKRFRTGQVLFGKRRAYQRKVAVAEFDGICSSDILTFEPKDEALLPDLLPFIVQSEGFFEHALGTSSGSLSPRTRWSQLQDYKFPLPPKDEQRRIAKILWAADQCRKRYLNAFDWIEKSRRSALNQFFAPGIRDPGSQEIQHSRLPGGWRLVEARTGRSTRSFSEGDRQVLGVQTCRRFNRSTSARTSSSPTVAANLLTNRPIEIDLSVSVSGISRSKAARVIEEPLERFQVAPHLFSCITPGRGRPDVEQHLEVSFHVVVSHDPGHRVPRPTNDDGPGPAGVRRPDDSGRLWLGHLAGSGSRDAVQGDPGTGPRRRI